MKIGLICEGITDYIVIENIICGYLGVDDDDINQLQPVLDETSQKQASDSFGGWEKVLTYLQATDFIDAADNHDYLIIQIDTDICEHKNFGVGSMSLAQHQQPEFYDLIKQRLIAEVNKRYNDNFSKYANKIIFCICIHSLECWLLAHYQSKPPTSPKIVNCENALDFLFKKVSTKYQKDYPCYNRISQPFLKKSHIENAIKQSLSFNLFIQQLQQITLS